MSAGTKIGRLRSLLFLARNSLTVTGAALATAAAVSLLWFWLIELLGRSHGQAYAGLLFVLALPAVFVLGLLLIPLGMWWRWRAHKRHGAPPTEYPPVDWRDPLLRRAVVTFGLLTVANVGILGTASYHSLEYMDSTDFCGLACHSVMAPEHGAHLNSPHSRVPCVECHIGPGATGFVRAKLNGTRQLLALARGTYARPIPSPVRRLRPARETCENCHWPAKFQGDKLLLRKEYAADEKNTESLVALVMKLGGSDARGVQGIHGRHLDSRLRITYVAIDEKRQVIPRVTSVDEAGHSVEFVSSEIKATPEQLARGEHRSMDCIDCHNRPAHAFQLPERALDEALAQGTISPQLPWIKRQAVELLRAEYPDRATAAQRIPAGLASFYRLQQPQVYQQSAPLVETAAQRLVQIYERNVFPAMRLTWGTHPNNLGHEDSLGCFRCHDDNHKSEDGRVISQDCGTCHTQVDDPKVLSDLGIQ